MITVQFQNESVNIEPVVKDGNVLFKVYFDHPIYLEKELDGDGAEYWIEMGVGSTVRAQEIGELINQHPELI